jgi:hypothetical protein
MLNINSPKVLNFRKDVKEENTVNIGRPSKFGNPFIIGKDGSRDDVCDKYKVYLFSNLILVQAVKEELKGKNLICWCSPLRCHGDLLLELANESLAMDDKTDAMF